MTENEWTQSIANRLALVIPLLHISTLKKIPVPAENRSLCCKRSVVYPCCSNLMYPACTVTALQPFVFNVPRPCTLARVRYMKKGTRKIRVPMPCTLACTPLGLV